ncbi:MAG TPA: hypothetical protein VIH87_09485 [Methylocella sp.]
MKDKIVEDVEDEARGFLYYIEDCIRGALSPENSRVLTPENKRELEKALDRLRPSFDDLAKWFIDPMRETSPSRAMYGYEKLWALLAAVFVGGSRGTITDSGEIYFINYVKTQKMRDARASAPAEVALRAAIEAERRPGQIEHPWKEASAIRDAVNKRLKSDGFGPVKVGKILLRLTLRS